jgi:hypothetical protein
MRRFRPLRSRAHFEKKGRHFINAFYGCARLKSVHLTDKGVASLLAFATGLGAHTAVFVLILVLLTFTAADLAGHATYFQLRRQQPRLRLRLPGKHAARGLADIRAVVIQPDASGQVLKMLFSKTRIRTGNAGLGAVEAGVDALGQSVA